MKLEAIKELKGGCLVSEKETGVSDLAERTS